MSQASEKPAYSPGLADVIAGESAICWVSPNAGLQYRGYNIEELAGRVQFEQIAWLLLAGELPTPEQLEGFRRDLAVHRALPESVMSMLRLLPATAHPIDVLRTGISMLGPLDPEVNDHSHAANLRKATRIVAKMSTLITAAARIAQKQAPLRAKDDVDFSARFCYELSGKEPEDWRIKAMDVVLALYAEHEFNASTFAARVTVSTMSDMYAGVTSALGTLKGPLHGGANEAAMGMIREIGSPEKAEAWLLPRLAKKQKIMGFGHRVYKTGDSRVPVMRELARQLGERFGETTLVPICEKLEEVMVREKKLYSNLDLYAAPALHLLGIPSTLDISVFAASRVAGWCAHIIEQHDHNRIIRPRCIYTGPAERKMQG